MKATIGLSDKILDLARLGSSIDLNRWALSEHRQVLIKVLHSDCSDIELDFFNKMSQSFNEGNYRPHR